MRLVVVGGVAGGMSCAARARRLSEDADIVVLERGPYVSFATCGLPYHVADEIPDRSSLLLHSPQSLAASLALDVRPGHEVTAVHPDRRTVSVRPFGSAAYELAYDALVLATGAAPVRPPLPGMDLPQVHVLRTVPDADAVRAAVDAGARRAVVVGAGFVGLEMAEALHRRGLAVTLVELSDQVLPPLDPEMARPVELELVRAGVDVRLGTSLREVAPADGGAVVVTVADGSTVLADLVLLAAGVRPDTGLARAAGLTLDERGAVVVDEHLMTSAPGVYAVGDAVVVPDAVTGAPVTVPLAGPANRQGRAVADHLFGRTGGRTPVLGTAIVRVLDVVAATTGRSEKSLRAAGVDHRAVHVHPAHHAGYYPGARPLHLKLVVAPDGRVLGAQATGSEGVDKRIDVIATAIRAGMHADDLADLELAYAPPFGSAKDPVNQAGFVAGNVLRGDLVTWRAADLADLPEGAVLLDVRSAAEFAAGHLPGAVNVPHTELRDRLAEVPTGRPLLVHCASGFRSYLAARVLLQRGWGDVRSLSGGLATLRLEAPSATLVDDRAAIPG